MLLAIDIGNTNIVLGVFDGKRLAHSWRLTTLRERTADELGLLVHGLFDVSRIDRKAVRSVIMASVVPPLTSPARGMVERYFNLTAMVVEPGLETGMPMLYDTPPHVGAFVERVAHKELTTRAHLIAAMESGAQPIALEDVLKEIQASEERTERDIDVPK